MSANIRRQSIISSLVIYFGFAVGLLNTIFYTRQGLFTTEEYGLVILLVQSVIPLFASLATMAMPSFVYKFYPYYNDNLEPAKNDMFTWALLVSTIGFIIFATGGLVFKDLVYRKYSANSLLFVKYYYWMFPLAFGLTIYNVLEAYAWSLHKSVFTTFLKEVQWRLFATILIVLFFLKVIPNFDIFIKLFSFSYAGIALTLLIYLVITKKIHFIFEVSKVTRRFLKKITRFCTLIYSGGVVFTLSQVFDSMIIGSVLPQGMQKVGIFGLAQVLTSLIQAPQRGIVAASIPHLSQAWKDKKLSSIQRIYQRSSINQLIFASLMLILIILNYQDAVDVFHLKPEYLLGFNAFILLGLTRLIDMGTGVNAQIIGTSNYWRFELISGMVLLVFMLPLNYLLTKRFDILGPALANVISITIYNSIRIAFLWKKFRLFPFTIKSLYTILLGATVYFIGAYLFQHLHGWTGLFSKSLFTIVVFGLGVVVLKLTPDLRPVLQSLLNRYPFWRKPSGLD